MLVIERTEPMLATDIREPMLAHEKTEITDKALYAASADRMLVME